MCMAQADALVGHRHTFEVLMLVLLQNSLFGVVLRLIMVGVFQVFSVTFKQRENVRRMLLIKFLVERCNKLVQKKENKGKKKYKEMNITHLGGKIDPGQVLRTRSSKATK